ncbi:MAG: oxygenase MpaB family protein [Acidimicrobiales bacterium]
MTADVTDLEARRARRRPPAQPATPPSATPAEVVAGFAAGGAARAAAPVLGTLARSGLTRLFRPDGAPPAPVGAPAGPGWLGPDSAARVVHADASMFVGGIAALALQALHPRAMAGVADHSDFRHDPFGRLRRTASFLGTTTYGSAAEAEAACAMVRRVHLRVHGTTPDGRHYSADEPELLDWIHVAEVHSFAASHRRFGAHPLDDEGLDRYVDDLARVARELGDPTPPRRWAELDRSLAGHRSQLAVTESARSAWRFLVRPPIPLVARPAYRLLFLGAVASLPPWARRLWGVAIPATAELAACRGLVRGIGALLGTPPRRASPGRDGATDAESA